MPVSARKVVLLALNFVSTLLTLLTGLRENPVVVTVSGRYDHIRSRLIDGSLNYNIVREDVIFKSQLTDLVEVGKSFRFLSAPQRSPANLAEDRSTCVRVNSMNSTVMALNFDDFWGYGARRTQIFLYSISAPHCDVVNFKQWWYHEQCVTAIGGGDPSKCYQYILDNFDVLADDRVVQVGVEIEFGEPGVPFLKCLGRPERSFEFLTDLMVHQALWAGGSFHVEIQTSRCIAQPLIRNADWKYGLFQVEPADHAAQVVFAVDSTGWIAVVISFAYGVVSIVMIAQGVLAAVLRACRVKYLPTAVRFLHEWKPLKFVFPFMSAATLVTDQENRIVTFKGASFMASDVWMNHWLYIALSVLDAIASIRTTYTILEMGTWMLTKKVNIENFLFLCSALTRITWIMCFVHSLLRLGCKLALRSVRTLKVLRPALLAKLEWYVDASSLFLSYKIYSLLLCLVLFLMLKLNGSTTLMAHQPVFRRGVYGGDPDLAQFWGNEIICDLFVMVSIVLLAGLAFSSAMLLTRYRSVTHNGVIRLLQSRYGLVGWDVFIALEALGIDPFNAALVEDRVCKTSCSLGAVLQQLYTSGLSGHVNLAADYLFLENGFSKDPVKLRYPVKRAVEMGLCASNRSGSGVSAKYVPTQTTEAHSTKRDAADSTIHDDRAANSNSNARAAAKSIFDRQLRLVSDGYLGRILLVDESEPGRFVKSSASAVMEFEVQDALSTLPILDIKPLLGNEKKLHIR